MIKCSQPSALVLATVLTLVLGACATQVRQNEPPKQEQAVVSEAKGNLDSPLPTGKPTRMDEHPDAGEEAPVITAENTVFFTLGSAALAYKDKRKLETIAERLVGDRTLHVSLLGYANDNGSTSFNLAVSDNRVVAVAAFLRKQGVHSEQIRVQALGSEKNPSNCRSSKCKQAFRRVDLVIFKNK